MKNPDENKALIEECIANPEKLCSRKDISDISDIFDDAKSNHPELIVELVIAVCDAFQKTPETVKEILSTNVGDNRFNDLRQRLVNDSKMLTHLDDIERLIKNPKKFRFSSTGEVDIRYVQKVLRYAMNELPELLPSLVITVCNEFKDMPDELTNILKRVVYLYRCKTCIEQHINDPGKLSREEDLGGVFSIATRFQPGLLPGLVKAFGEVFKHDPQKLKEILPYTWSFWQNMSTANPGYADALVEMEAIFRDTDDYKQFLNYLENELTGTHAFDFFDEIDVKPINFLIARSLMKSNHHFVEAFLLKARFVFYRPKYKDSEFFDSLGSSSLSSKIDYRELSYRAQKLEIEKPARESQRSGQLQAFIKFYIDLCVKSQDLDGLVVMLDYLLKNFKGDLDEFVSTCIKSCAKEGASALLVKFIEELRRKSPDHVPNLGAIQGFAGPEYLLSIVVRGGDVEGIVGAFRLLGSKELEYQRNQLDKLFQLYLGFNSNPEARLFLSLYNLLHFMNRSARTHFKELLTAIAAGKNILDFVGRTKGQFAGIFKKTEYYNQLVLIPKACEDCGRADMRDLVIEFSKMINSLVGNDWIDVIAMEAELGPAEMQENDNGGDVVEHMEEAGANNSAGDNKEIAGSAVANFHDDLSELGDYEMVDFVNGSLNDVEMRGGGGPRLFSRPNSAEDIVEPDRKTPLASRQSELAKR